MAPAGGLKLPLLEGVRPTYTHAAGRPLAAAFAARLVETGLADPADWKRAERDPIEFLNATLAQWQSAAGGDHVGEEYAYVGGGILTDIRTFFWEAAHDHRLDRLWVVFDHVGMHDLVEMCHVTTLLERVHPRLPATFHECLRSLNRVGFVWDSFETREWMDMYGDWIIERELGHAADARANGEEPEDHRWPIEITDNDRSDYPLWTVKEMRLPALCRKRLAESTVRRMLPGLTPRVRKIMELAVEIDRETSTINDEKLKSRRHFHLFDELDLHETSHRMPPVLVLPMERYDAIERAWDEENMAMAQMGEPVQPLLAFHFDATDDDDLRWAHEKFAAVVGVYANLAQLLPLLPTADPATLAESLVDLEVDP